MCSTWARIASGVVSLLGLRKIAVPGSRTIGGSAEHRPSRNSCSGPSSRLRLLVSFSRPLRHVSITLATTSADHSGSQAPCSILVTLAEKNEISTR